MPWRGLAFLSGAQPVRFSLKVYRSFTGRLPIPVLHVFSRLAARLGSSAFPSPFFAVES
jgi:hypothetical protein